MSQRTCLHCGASFTQTGPGRNRRWCYGCQGHFPPDDLEGRKAYMVRASQLAFFVKSGEHGTCCGLDRLARECSYCGGPFRVSAVSRSNRSYCQPCHNDYMRARRLIMKRQKPAECRWCFASFMVRGADLRGSTCCSGSCTAALADHARKHRSPDRCHLPICIDCGTSFPYVLFGAIRCSVCRVEHDKNRSGLLRRRATVRAGDGSITWRSAGTRLGWDCALCGDVVARTHGAPSHPNGATIDHVRPIARGGLHEWENVQLAHWHCNVKKGARTA